MNDLRAKTWLPDLTFTEGRFASGLSLASDDGAHITGIAPVHKADGPTVALRNRAILPGLVNAHSHAFQRVIRGRTEYRTSHTQDSFWTWRKMMYSAANRLTPEDIYDASRMAFLEMALSGITTVGEFHYLHHSPEGTPYNERNLLATKVVQAARDVGVRIALLLVAYVRSGYQTESNPRQLRFIEPDSDIYLQRAEQLRDELENTRADAWIGLAPHSVRAVPLDYLQRVISFAGDKQLPVHMHVAEQAAEVQACIQEYGRPPVELLHSEGLLSKRFTAVHAIHLTPAEISALGETGARVCACPTTERNLGDGIVPVDALFGSHVPVSLGTDSQIQIDLLEDARELEYHLRLKQMARAVLAPKSRERSALAERLFTCATVAGAESLGARVGRLEVDCPVDFFTVDLDDPSVAGSSPDDLLSNIIFSLPRSAVKDVVVGGKVIVRDGRHEKQEEIVANFKALQKKLWGGA